jgi:hypothetical protein
MSKPPGEGYWFFSGHRRIRGTQRVCVDEPVCVCYQWHGTQKQLAVMMLGRQHSFRIESFDGTWVRLEYCEVTLREPLQGMPQGGPT